MTKRRSKTREPFAMMFEETLLSEAWGKLTPAAQNIYQLLKCQWNTYNTESLALPYKRLIPRYCPSTINGVFKELQRHDWIVKVRPGGLMKQCNLFALTGTHDKQVRRHRNSGETPYMRTVKPIVDQVRREEKRKEAAGITPAPARG